MTRLDVSNGLVRLLAHGRPLLALGPHVHRSVRVADVRSRLAPGTGEVAVSPPGRIRAGDAVEIRNEYRFGRANYPKRHAAVVTHVHGDRIAFDPPIEDESFDDARATFVRALDSEQSLPLSILEIRGDHARAEAAGRDLEVVVELRITADGPRLRVERRWRRDVTVEREHLVLHLLAPLRRVHRRNRRSVTHAFESMHWLDDQGFAVDAGRDHDLLLLHPRELAAIELHHRCPVSLEALTPFRAPPHDVEAMRDADVTRYASASARRGTVRFAATLPEPVELAGARFTWHGAATRPERVRIRAVAERRWPRPFGRGDVVADASPPEASTFTLRFRRPVRGRRLEIECRPGAAGNVTIRHWDLLRGGSGHDAQLVLDDARLHRHYHVPKDAPRAAGIGGMVCETRHWISRAAGTTQIAGCELRLLPRGQADAVPRPMHVPDGREAAFIWTEHADNASLAAHRAVCLGRSDVLATEHAVGGFVGHGVPVTKTVFHANPSSLPVVGGDGPQVSIRDCPDFARLCDELRELGFDIGLHSPQPDNSTREANEEAIAAIADRYGATVWIDHSSAVIRNGVTAWGMVPGQPHFIGDLLERHGFRWCWTFASEDGAELYRAGLSVMQTRPGDWTVTPMTWRRPDQTGGLAIWPSSAGADLGILDDAELDELVADRGVAVTHSYPAYHYPPGRESPFFRAGEDGVLHARPEFEAVLARLAARRDSGRLLLTTIARWAAYVEALRRVRVVPRPDGGWTIRNEGSEAVRGFTFAVVGDPPRLDVPHRTTAAGDDTLVTLDLPAADEVEVSPPAPASRRRGTPSRPPRHAAPAAGRS